MSDLFKKAMEFIRKVHNPGPHVLKAASDEDIQAMRQCCADPDYPRITLDCSSVLDILERLRQVETANSELSKPVPMVLFCPACGEQHLDDVDEAKGWLNPPHRSHLCLLCGHIWRPADVPTNGVKRTATTGSADSPAVGNRAKPAASR